MYLKLWVQQDLKIKGGVILNINQIFRKSISKLTALLILVCMIIVVVIPVSAESLPDMPYSTYTYWENAGSKTPIEIKPTHKVVNVLDGFDLGIGSFNELQHAFSFENYLYVLDSGNGRIVVLDKEYKVEKKIDSFKFSEEEIDITGAKGLFVDKSGMYIADTANKRILFVKDDTVQKIIERPDSTIIPETFDFAPSRLIRDSSGYLYVLCEGSYYGIMVFSEKFELFGFFGANNVQTNFVNAIKDFIENLFETEEKHNASVKKLPYSLLDICIDNEGFIAGINDATAGQIRRFGLVGTNTLKKKSDFSISTTDSFNFADNPVMFLDETSKYQVFFTARFSALTADSKGYYYAVDTTHGRIFIYDTKSNLISVFGGGRQNGQQEGTFLSPSAIAVFGDDVIVTDFSSGKITVFRPTEYGKTFMYANSLTNKSDYLEAKPYWEQINAQDKNNQLAWRGLAKAALKEKDYSKCLEYSKAGLDRKTYAQAFKFVRDDFLSRNFWWICAVSLILIGGILTFIIYSKNKQITVIKNQKLRIAVRTFYHPFESFDLIKQKNMGSPIIATVFLFLFYISSIVIKLNGGFMFGNIDLSEFNAILTLLGTIGIAILWVTANWLVSVLFEGKGKIKEIYCATCYNLLPLIIYNFSYTVLSHVLIPTANSPFELFSNVCYLLTALLLLLSISVIHDFSFFKAIGVALAIILAMAIVVFVLFLILTLWQDALSFILGLINEISLR